VIAKIFSISPADHRVPLLGIGFLGDVARDKIVHDLLAHVRDLIAHIVRRHDLTPLLEDDARWSLRTLSYLRISCAFRNARFDFC